MNRSIIKEGTWLYDNKALSKIAIEYRDIAYGSGDYEDSVEVSEDRLGEFFYIIFYSPAEKDRIVSETGPFGSLLEAEAHCVNTTNGTINWQSK
ncbi:hypothetical protein [Pleionea litopenaei]|uniref:Uncharacterized protein n=1 Tax=Pleionea litopenaei TaxID=3070815 RepID=A0AA51X8A1_9GAMM|nr:hypothetical protein [Pleionea sp. HL-JVS1]WMS88736.1 hypothetical protein Q9312_07415 [Pleionea sp. HL-JVS1]